MIHLRKEGEFLRLGLNITVTRWRLTVCWAWFQFDRHQASARGFTLSRNGLRLRSERWDVIDHYLRLHELTLVREEVLRDLKDTEVSVMRRNDDYAYLTSGRPH